MKKLLLMATLAVATLSVNAQTWIGGKLGYTFAKEKDDDNGLNSWCIAPEIGYDLNDNWAIAAAIHYEGSKYDDVKSNVFSFNPYVRYRFAKYGNVSFFADGSVDTGFGSLTEDDMEDVDITVFIAGFKPGISYAICDKIGLVAHFGILGYQFQKTDDVKVSSFGFDLTNNITFGVYINL